MALLTVTESQLTKQYTTQQLALPLATIFWAFIELIYIFSNLLKHLNDWSISCPCHDPEVCKSFDMVSDALSCLLRGCRVPEIALGALEIFLEEASNLNHAQLLSLINDASEPTRARVVNNFEAGKRLLPVLS